MGGHGEVGARLILVEKDGGEVDRIERAEFRRHRLGDKIIDDMRTLRLRGYREYPRTEDTESWYGGGAAKCSISHSMHTNGTR